MRELLTCSFDYFIIIGVFDGDKRSPWDYGNMNNYTIYVNKDGKQVDFDYWTGITNPHMESEKDLLQAFADIIDEACSGDYTFIEFMDEFDYDTHRGGWREGYQAWEGVVRTREKILSIYNGDLYTLREKIEGVVNNA